VTDHQSEDEHDAPMPAALRRDRMLAMVRAREFARVADLAAAFGISDVTVRSDLHALQRDGRLRRVHGGAVALAAWPRTESSFEESLDTSAAEKAALGVAAAALVRDGESVLLDVGTTTTAIARALVMREDLTDLVVFTNGINIALALEPAIPRFTVVVTGGTLRPLQHSLVDPLADSVLSGITADTLFLGCGGVSAGAGVTNINLPEAAVKRRMIDRARRTIAVADGSKIGRAELAPVCPATAVDLLLTGASADTVALAELRDVGLAVETVPAG
jgi:DeoR family transcriptional regulator of aga operon